MAEWQHVQDEMSKNAKEQLEELVGTIRARGLKVDIAVSENDPADAITNAAGSDAGTLIAISTLGRSGVGRWMLGERDGQGGRWRPRHTPIASVSPRHRCTRAFRKSCRRSRRLPPRQGCRRPRHGQAAAAILDEVGEQGDALVVMATHGRSGVGRWLLGVGY
jgi:nucleotide-binding universal stress UspA family protein